MTTLTLLLDAEIQTTATNYVDANDNVTDTVWHAYVSFGNGLVFEDPNSHKTAALAERALIRKLRGAHDINIKVSRAGANGIARTREAELFEREAHLHGFEAADLGREIAFSGTRCRIMGLVSGTKPILLERLDNGYLVKARVAAVQRALSVICP